MGSNPATANRWRVQWWVRKVLPRASALVTRAQNSVDYRDGQRVLDSYLQSDRRPWRQGYAEYRDQYLRKVVEDESLIRIFRDGAQLPEAHGFRLDARVVEIPWVLSRVRPGILLDAGSSLNYDYVLKSAALADSQITITTLAPESRASWQLGVSYVYGDLRHLDFRDGLFDTIACISTIEHVGMDNSMYAGDADFARRGDPAEFLSAVRELKRVLKPGGVLCITFPFGRYENHGWFQQFDSELVDTLIDGFNPASFKESVFRYEPDGWKLSNRVSCSECQFFDVHTSKYFNPDSTIEYPLDYPAGERALMCLELRK